MLIKDGRVYLSVSHFYLRLDFTYTSCRTPALIRGNTLFPRPIKTNCYIVRVIYTD